MNKIENEEKLYGVGFCKVGAFNQYKRYGLLEELKKVKKEKTLLKRQNTKLKKDILKLNNN